MADKIRQFFTGAQEIFDAFPGYVKVFLYATISSVAGLYFTNTLSFDGVLMIVLINLGLYGGQKGIQRLK